jgi:hypothetical protein
LVSLIAFTHCHEEQPTQEYRGSFHANDSGESHGGFEWAGEYDAALTVQDHRGELVLVFSRGLGDPLKIHSLSITAFSQTNAELKFMIDGRDALLHFVEKDTIWNEQYDKRYIANNSTKVAEQIGKLPIEPFTGFRPHYYIELRLAPAEPAQNLHQVN